MAVTQNSYIGNGSTTNYAFTFPYLKTSDVKAQIDATVTTAFTLANATTVQFNTAPASGAKIKIYRETDDSALTATFYAGSAIKSEDLNDNFTQNLYTTQEVSARYLSNLGGTMVGDMTMAEDVDIVFEGATDDAHETRLTVADPTADRTITIPNVTGTVITTGDTGTVTSTMLADATIVAADLASNAVTTAKITDGNVTTAKIAADAITSAKIADDQINSEHYVDGSIDTAHIANLNVTTAKIANDAITGAKIADDAVDSEHYAADSIDTEHYAPASVDTAALANTSVTTAKIANDAITGSQIADNAITSDHMSSNSVVLSNMSDNSVGTAEIVDDAVTNAKIASGAVDTTNIAGSALITNSEQASTTGNDTTLLTSAASDSRYFKQDSTETISSGQTWTSSDSYIATTGAVNARILDLVDDVGGFKTIDNETSFPDTNPDPQNGTGTIISIKGLATAIVTGSGETTKTISNGNVSNNATITITGLTESTTYGQGMGLLVETTSTTHTYTFHRLVPPPTAITTVSNNIASVNTTAANITSINDFADKYRIANSAPSSNNDEGDLYYNTNNNRLYVYNGTSWDVAASLNGSGGNVTGDTTFTDGTKLKFGTGEDLEIYHDGSAHHSYIDNTHASGHLYIRNTGIDSNVYIQSRSGEHSIWCHDDNSVDIYYNGVKKFETTSTGTLTSGTKAEISATGASDEPMLKVTSENGQIFLRTAGSSGSFPTGGGGDDGELLYLGGDFRLGIGTASKNLIFMNGGSYQERARINSSGSFKLPDSAKIELGGAQTGSGDLQIYHSGTNSVIDNNTGGLYIRNNVAADVGGDIFIQAKSGENSAIFTHDGGAALHYDNAVKLETTSTGVTIPSKALIGTSTAAPYTTRLLTVGDTGTDDTALEIRSSNDSTGRLYYTDSTVSGEGAYQGELTFSHIDNSFYLKIGNETSLKAIKDGAVELYYDNFKSFETHANGITVIGPEGGGGILRLYGDEGDDNADKWDLNANTNGTLLVRNYASGSWENSIIATGNGNVELYYDNAKKLETISTGVLVTGKVAATGDLALTSADSQKARFGLSNDLEIYHDGTDDVIHSTGTNLRTRSNNFLANNAANNEVLFRGFSDGQFEAYYDGSEKLETTSSGVTITGNAVASSKFRGNDDVKLSLGDGEDLQIYHDGNNSKIVNWTGNLTLNATSTEVGIDIKANGAVELYYNNVKKLETISGGVLTHGNSYVNDSDKFIAGTGNDLQIYHNGSNTYIDNNIGDIYIRNNVAADVGADIHIRAKASENSIIAKDDGAVELYYDGVKKFETTSGGVNVTGTVTTDGLTSDGASYFNADTIFDGATSGRDMWWDKSANSLKFYDLAAIKLGNDDDLRIYHAAGSHSYIENTSGDLILNGDTIRLKDGGNNETLLTAVKDGAVELYYDGVKKLETTSTGATLSGNLTLDLGSGNNAYISNANAGGLIFQADENGHTFQTWSSSWQTRLQITDAGIVNIPDNGKFTAGSSNDLEIYHNGSHGFIDNNTGYLYIDTAGNILLRVTSDNDDGIKVIGNGAVQLFYDNSKKLETYSNGLSIFGHTWQDDNHKAIFGTGNDLNIYHDGSHSYIANTTGDLLIRNSASNEIKIQAVSGEQSIVANANGSVDLYYDNAKVFYTSTAGSIVKRPSGGATEFSIYGCEGNAAELRLAADDGDDAADWWRLRGETSGNLNIQNYAGGAWETNITAAGNGAVELYYDNSKTFETTSFGVDVHGTLRSDHITLDDNSKLKIGASNDLEIYHDGSNTYIDNNIGDIYIRNNVAADVGADIHIRAKASENSIIAKDDGAVELFYDGTKKLETTADGVKITDDSSYQLELKRDGSGNQQAGIKFIDGGDATGRIIGYGGHVQIGVSPSSNSYEDAIMCNANGSVELYYNGTSHMKTTGEGIDVHNVDDAVLTITTTGTDAHDDARLEFITQESTFKIQNDRSLGTDGALTIKAESEDCIYMYKDGAVELYYDDVKKLNTESWGATIQGQLKVIGAESANAQIEMFADEGDDNADKWELDATTGGEFFLRNYAHGSWKTAWHSHYNAHHQSPQFNGPAGGIRFDQNIESPTADQWSAYNGDGMLHRSTGQAYITVDDWLYIRDMSSSQSKRFQFNTDNGNAGAQNDWQDDQFDFAEMFEWSDGNPSGEDRIGNTVAVDGLTGKIKIAEDGDTVIGVVSGTAAFTANAGTMGWQGQYLRDEWGRYILEDNTNQDGTAGKKLKVNPDFDPTKEYQTREERKEWDKIGIIGQCYVRKTAVKPSSWIKLKEVDSVKDFYLIK